MRHRQAWPKAVRLVILYTGFFLSAGCLRQYSGAPAPAPAADAAGRFDVYLNKGNEAYARKAGYSSFAKSLKYFDSARSIADQSGDTALIAEAVFAKGRIYDAWNKEPQKTILLFREAATLFRTRPEKYRRYLYAKHLIAHAYDKVQDSVGATAVLRELYAELQGQDTGLLHSVPFTAEMALIATEVRAYGLADSILKTLTRREWIVNDSSTYDYLNHYYLTQSRLDVFWRKAATSRYLDSFRSAYEHSDNLLDHAYYADNLAKLHAANGAYREAYHFKSVESAMNDSLNNGQDITNMQRALAQSEQLAEQRRQEFETATRKSRTRLIWILSSLLAVITVLSVYLYRRNKKYKTQSLRLFAANEALDRQVAQVELLNKEIQHRVKNNLHMIYSLLEMQERKTENEATIEALQAAKLRVESIAALHNQLLNAKGSLDFSAYIKSLISSVVNCLSDEKKVVTHINTDTISLPVNHYFALSLILNEWVTNSIKYATSANSLIEINVSIRNEPHQVCIEYSDNGNAMHQAKAPGLGAQIVRLLTRQLSATLTILNNNPYHYQLCIPHGA